MHREYTDCQNVKSGGKDAKWAAAMGTIQISVKADWSREFFALPRQRKYPCWTVWQCIYFVKQGDTWVA